jgi:hypothetical protein
MHHATPKTETTHAAMPDIGSAASPDRNADGSLNSWNERSTTELLQNRPQRTRRVIVEYLARFDLFSRPMPENKPANERTASEQPIASNSENLHSKASSDSTSRPRVMAKDKDETATSVHASLVH